MFHLLMVHLFSESEILLSHFQPVFLYVQDIWKHPVSLPSRSVFHSFESSHSLTPREWEACWFSFLFTNQLVNSLQCAVLTCRERIWTRLDSHWHTHTFVFKGHDLGVWINLRWAYPVFRSPRHGNVHHSWATHLFSGLYDCLAVRRHVQQW